MIPKTWRFGFCVALALLLLPNSAAPAFAHARLVSTSPAADRPAAPAPTELRLGFSEPVELSFTKVEITASDGKRVETGPPQLDPNENTQVIVPLTAPLPSGRYTVVWQTVSADGHKINGSYRVETSE